MWENLQQSLPGTQKKSGLLPLTLEPPEIPGSHHPRLWMSEKSLVRCSDDDDDTYVEWETTFIKGLHLYRRETGDEASVCGCLGGCSWCHRHDCFCWCWNGHGDWGIVHHGLLMLRHDGCHGHGQGREVGHWWGRELAEDFHVHCWEATLKQRKLKIGRT